MKFTEWFAWLKPILVVVFCTAVVHGQQSPDPRVLLHRVSQEYRNAKYFRIETQLSDNESGDFTGHWEKSFQTAIVVPGRRYRFEAKGPGYSWVQVSNGMNEWVYNSTAQEYVQKRTAASGKPSQFGRSEWSFLETALIESQAIPEGLADEIAFARDPMFTGSETLSFGTDTVDCFVVRAKGRYRSGWSPDTKVDLTFWIDKSALTIRKIEEDWEGQLTMGDAARSKRTNTKVFPVVELADPHEPTDLFEFQIPPGAKLVTDFKLMSPPPMRQHPGLVGSMAPAVKFQSTDGHAVLLNSFRGKPVLIEFWATWWGPCVAALPKLERLYAEAQSHDIAVVTIDEDETADKATAYLTTHANPTWANYHDDGEINRAIPGEGLPEFVLIDAHGKIVFEKSGVDEHELRAAFAHLGFDLER